MKRRNRSRKSRSSRSAWERRRVRAGLDLAASDLSKMAAISALTAVHSSNQGRITTGSTISIILSWSV